MTLYIFDVDGTLTEPAQRMEEDFAAFFRLWAHDKRHFLTSGSTLETMRRQVPPDIMAHAEGWFPCQGNEFWRGGEVVYRRHFASPPGLFDLLSACATSSPAWRRAGNCIESRGSMWCYAIPGRAATAEQRAEYAAWDERTGERERVAAFVRAAYPDLSVAIGGQISIDIASKGMDKGQILPAIREFSSLPIVFFADRAHEGGNDYPLAEALRAESTALNAVMHVTCPRDTRAMLETMEAHDCCC